VSFPLKQARIRQACFKGALKSFANAISADAKGACAPDIHRQLIESSGFFGISAKAVQIMASQIAEFFCGVISK